jgi:glyoxylase-like metal-dependent hydrolase (beta-lactamase superfamily II)
VAPLAEAGRLRAVPSGAEIAPGIVLRGAGGHTPGHHAVLVRDRLLIPGDAWHNPAQVEVAAWCHRADHDKQAAVAARTRLAAEARDRGWLVAAGHFTEENAFGRIIGEGGALSFQPRLA